uniref:ATP synthase complex subunit 8 n=1 Tax=Hylobius abietis TaxID=201999 RepID=J9PHQ9_HYLAI|nr:ATP synthase F0 subunit 8 [Hylobius abietis]
MPQMAPLNWLTLYLFFFLIFITNLILNYYMFLYSPQKIQTNHKKNY